jgi:hypothetical protein
MTTKNTLPDKARIAGKSARYRELLCEPVSRTSGKFPREYRWYTVVYS